MKSKIFNIVVFIFGLAILVWVILDTGPAVLWTKLSSIGWSFVWVVLVYLLETVIEVGAWQLLVPPHRRTGYFRMFAVSQAGAALNGLLPGQTGEVVKGTLLAGHMKTRWIVSSLLIYNFLFIATTLPVLLICALTVLISGCLPLNVSLILFAAVGLSAILPTLLFIWIRRGMIGDILRAVKRLPLVGRLIKESLVEEGRKIDHETRATWKHRPADFMIAAILLVAARFLGIVEVWLILFLMGSTVSVPMAAGIFAAGQVFAYATMVLPTSFGVLEGGTKGIFQWFGLAGEIGLSLELVRRIRKFFFMFVGIICLGLLSILDPAARRVIGRNSPDDGGSGPEDGPEVNP